MYHVAGISRSEFSPFYVLQALRNWCWAACIQMVLGFHGVDVKQEDVVARIYRDLVNEPANDEKILEALSGWAFDYRGRRVEIESTSVIHSDEEIIGDLDRHQPLVVGLNRPGATGHLYVLTQVEYWSDDEGCECTTAYLTDPARHDPLILDWREFRRRLGFIARVRVIRGA